VVLLSSSRTKLITSAPRGIYAACLRNQQAQVDHLAGRRLNAQIIGAGARGKFSRNHTEILPLHSW
jgi:phosphosulfolactate phosphohydrolase-like enzyme